MEDLSIKEPDSQRTMELKLIYAIVVAGKSAKFANNVIDRMFGIVPEPFKYIKGLIEEGDTPLLDKLKESRAGNYHKLYTALKELIDADYDLAKVTVEQLERIHGIGPKTARFYVLWVRPEERYAILDIHILRWLKDQGYVFVPQVTPPGKQYKKWEDIFLMEADNRLMTPRALDLEIWEAASTAKNIVKEQT